MEIFYKMRFRRRYSNAGRSVTYEWKRKGVRARYCTGCYYCRLELIVLLRHLTVWRIHTGISDISHNNNLCFRLTYKFLFKNRAPRLRFNCGRFLGRKSKWVVYNPVRSTHLSPPPYIYIYSKRNFYAHSSSTHSQIFAYTYANVLFNWASIRFKRKRTDQRLLLYPCNS